MFVFRTFSALFKLFLCYQGRRVPLRFTLAPGYYIARLRRWAFALAIILRAFGAGALPWLLYFAPSALGVARLFYFAPSALGLALAVIFRAFGAGHLPWLLYFAPSALGVCPGYYISRLRRWAFALAILFRAFGAQFRLLVQSPIDLQIQKITVRGWR